MKTLIIIILILIIAQTTTLEELKGIPLIGVIVNDIYQIDELERVVELIEPEPTPWPTATPTVVNHE